MVGQLGFFDIDSRLRELSAKGDDLERISALVDFEVEASRVFRRLPIVRRSFCTALGFWDTGLKPTLPWRRIEAVPVGTDLA